MRACGSAAVAVGLTLFMAGQVGGQDVEIAGAACAGVGAMMNSRAVMIGMATSRGIRLHLGRGAGANLLAMRVIPSSEALCVSSPCVWGRTSDTLASDA